MIRTLPAMIAAALLLAACSSNSRKDLAFEVSSLAKVGEPVGAAITKLKAAGFKCGNNYLGNFVPGDLLCDRRRSYYIVATCIQRVIISTDQASTLISRLNVQEPACAGL